MTQTPAPLAFPAPCTPRPTIVRDASELSLAPGYWPETLSLTPGCTVFARATIACDAEGDVLYARYVSLAGVDLIVAND
jgi:hypothetical protein